MCSAIARPTIAREKASCTAALRLIHTPVHASWLNQIEIYFSIVQRKVLTPNNFDTLAAVARRLNGFERHYNEIAEPFGWDFTREKARKVARAPGRARTRGAPARRVMGFLTRST